MPRKADRIGYCIYCGSTSGPLSDEHIVPYSLGGDSILQGASCTACADTTSRFELHIARRQLGPFRVRSELPTRRPNERPKSLPLGILDKEGKERVIEVDPQKHPGTLLLPDLPEPSLLVPILDPSRRSFRMFYALPDTDTLQQLKDEHDADAIGLGSFEIGSFYLLLAKIAHAGAFYHPGNWTLSWEPLLPDLIVGEREDYESFVGGTGITEFEADDGTFPVFYRTVAVESALYLVAFFRLYGQNDSPTYQVVVGRRRTKLILSSLEEVRQMILPGSLSELALLPADLESVQAYLNNQKERAIGGDDGVKDEPGDS